MRADSRVALFLLLLVAAVVPACTRRGEAPPPEYRGVMQSGCAPHDAPSTTIDLEATAGPERVSFNLWPSSGVMPPTRIAFGDQYAVGQGVYCTGPGSCRAATRGAISIKNSPDSGELTGEWSLELEDGTVVRGAYRAEWLAIQALCG